MRFLRVICLTCPVPGTPIVIYPDGLKSIGWTDAFRQAFRRHRHILEKISEPFWKYLKRSNMAILKQNIQQALSLGRNRFITSWDKFIMLVADYFFRDHLPVKLHNGCSTSPSLNGLILALRHMDGFCMEKIIINAVNTINTFMDQKRW